MSIHTPIFAASSVLDRHAVYSRERTWTWRDVHAASRILADRLAGKDVVVNMCESYTGFLVTWLAATRLGALQVLPTSDKRTHFDTAPLSHEQPIVVFDTVNEPDGWLADCPQVFWKPDTYDAHIAGKSLELPDLSIRSRVCLYTSGSTGAPQPEIKTVSQLIAGAHMLGARVSDELGVSLDQVACLVSSVAPRHMFGIEAVLMLSLVHGIAVLDRRPLLPADVVDALQVFPGGAVWIATPLHMRALARAGCPAVSCRAVISSTMPLDTATARRLEHLSQAPVVEVYGSTETGAIATRRTACTDEWQLLKGVQINPGESGVVVRSGQSELARHLNDIVQQVATDRFRLVGRSNDMIKVAGHRASLVGLNLIIQGLPGLEESVLYMPSSGPADQRPVLIYSGERMSVPYIRAILDKKMVSVFIPRTLIQVEQLPRSGTGKLMLHELDRLYRTSLWHKHVGKHLVTSARGLMGAGQSNCWPLSPGYEHGYMEKQS